MVIIPHVEKIQGFLLKEGVRDVPQIVARMNLDKAKFEPNGLLKDQQIASFTREIFRFGLILDIRGVTESTRDDVRSFATDIFNDDNRSFDGLIKLMAKKNWLIPPPTI